MSAVRDCSFSIFASSAAWGRGCGFVRSHRNAKKKNSQVHMGRLRRWRGRASQASAPPPNLSKEINLKKYGICHVLTPKIMIMFLDIIFSVLNCPGRDECETACVSWAPFPESDAGRREYVSMFVCMHS